MPRSSIQRKRLVSNLAGYALALAATGLAALVRWLLPAALTPAPYLGFYPAVVVAAALGGVGPGLVATFGSLLLVNFVFGHFNIHDGGAMVRQVIWVVASMGVSLLAGRQRAARLGERIQTDTARESEQRLRAIGDNLPGTAIYQQVREADGQVRFTYMSAGIEKVLGMTAERVLAEPAAFRQLILAEDRACCAAAEEQSARQMAPFDCEFRQQTPTGDIRWVHCRSTPRRLDDGAIVWNGAVTDITARKQAEAALSESEERYRSLFTTLIEGFCIIELAFDSQGKAVDYRFLEVNPAFEKQTGLKNVVGRFMRELAPANEASWYELYGRVALTGEPARFVNESKALDRWFDVSAFRVGGAESRKVAILFNDVTEAKRAEAALRLSEKKFAQAFAQNPAAIAISRLEDGLIYEVNDTWVALNGYSRDEVLGRSVGELNTWPSADAAKRFVEVLTKNGSLRGWEQAFRKKSGEGFVAELSAQILLVDGEQVILSTLVDITHRKRAEMRLRRFYETDLFAVLYWKIDGGVVDVNDQFLKMTGYTREEVHNGILNWAKITPPEYQELDEDARCQVRETGVHRPYEKEYIRKDGSRVWGLFSAAAYEDDRNQGVSFILDITDRKQADERLKLSLHEKEVMLKEIHHRVKNNLQVIASLVDMQTNAMDASLRGLFQDVRDRVRSMAMVHEKLYQSESMAHVDFANYTRSLLTYLARSHGNSKTAIGLKMDLQPVSLSVEKAVPCGLILNELITNAFKHAFHGRTNGEVTTSLRSNPDGRVSLRVSDNGIGLPEGMDWRKSRSLGLRLIHLLSGQLHAAVEVRLGEGTDFLITFELSHPEQSEDKMHA